MSLLTIYGSAPFKFFQDTEIGALTNRFSQDMELIDMMLPLVASMFLTGNILPLFHICLLLNYRKSGVWGWLSLRS